MKLSDLKCGDEVAVLPASGVSPDFVIEIACLLRIGAAVFHLQDGRMYSASTGRGLNCATYIVAATAEHRTAIKERKSPSMAKESV